MVKDKKKKLSSEGSSTRDKMLARKKKYKVLKANQRLMVPAATRV